MAPDRGRNGRTIVSYRGISVRTDARLAAETAICLGFRAMLSNDRATALKNQYGKPLINGLIEDAGMPAAKIDGPS